jgi:hypothetical protein
MNHSKLKIAAIGLSLLIGLITTALWLSRPTSPKRCIYDPYLPVGIFNQNQGRVVTEFYSAMQEEPFSCLDKDVEAYRFLLIPSFEPPACIRVWREGHQKYLELRQLSSVGTPQYGAKDMKPSVIRPLTEEEWNHFQQSLKEANFWSMSTRDGELIGIDGASLLLEGKRHSKYHVVYRRFPEDQNFLRACSYLFEISGLKIRQ